MLEKPEILEITRTLIQALEEKKAENIVLIDLRGLSVFTEFFVICSGTSERMLRSLLKTARETLQKEYSIKGSVQGEPSNGWIAVDYGSFVLHLFSPEQRNFYLLEDLWAEGKTLLRVQ
jgi:ribosome-associated protein